MKRFFILIVTMGLFMSGSARAEMPNGEYLEGKNSTTAVILAHGRAQGPDSKVVGPLRREINKELGFHTISLQMPVLTSTSFLDYAPTFPDAYKSIQAAIDYLIKEKGVKRIYLMGYSMGARMTTAFLALNPAPMVVGYIGVGILEGGGKPLDANKNLSGIHVPVLDIFDDQTPLDLKSASDRSTMVSETYKQVRISGADHSFQGYDDQIAKAVMEWFKDQEAKPAR